MDRKVLNLRFNQDQGCFSCAMESGVRIYNIEPLVEKCHYNVQIVGSVARCEMLNRTNLFAIVSGGTRPMCSDNILRIFDDLSKKFIMQISFPSSVLGVRLQRDKIFVALLTSIHVFSFPSPTQRLFSLETIRNPKGLIELSPTSDKQLLIFPGQKLGSVQIVDLSCSEVRTSSAPVWISAHHSAIGCLAISQDSAKIATSSVQGTLVRVWDVATKAKLFELRRGIDTATIYCINFSKKSEYLCCLSDKGTVHIFALQDIKKNKLLTLPGSCKLFGKSITSIYAFAKISLPPEAACICKFTEANAIIAVGLNGTFHKYVFSENGSCKRAAFDIFLDVYDDDETYS